MKRLFLFLTLMCLCAFGDKVSIPHLKGKSPIVVDGKINEDEYALSSLVGGLLLQQKNFLVNRDVEIYLTADEEALFLAARMSVENSDPDGGLVYQFQNKPKQHLCNDDCMEFFVASATEPLIYQILVNSSNVREAICHKAAKGSKVELNYECNGCIRNGYWEQELRIPWKSIPGINPEEFRFNCARNFVAGGLGYASFTGQKDIRDVKSMLQVKSVYGFGGVRLHGIDTSLCRGIFQLRCNGDGALSFSARCYNKDKTFIVNKPNEAQNILNDNSGKYVSLHVSHPKYGEVFRRSYVPFKLGGQLGGGPVTESIMLDGIGNLYLRHYPENAKCSVILSALGKAKSAKCEIVSPEGKVFAGDFVLQNDNSWKAMVHLPPKRPFGKYTGNLLLKEDAGERRMDNAFSFEEKNFEWLNNKIGISNKILPPFTPIEVNEANVLSTVQRKHFLAENGLLKQVNSMGNDILAAPMHFELHCQGKLLVEKNSKLQIVKKAPNRVVTKSRADFGAWKYQASTEWDYDGFALVKVRFTPPKDALAEKLTLRIPLKTSETTLMHALVDGARGNPGGYIPNGEGCVWTSENMLRWKNKQGVTVVPGEFVPYVWVGGEYRGICLLFDSPMGFALEDGKPMLHIFRNGDTLELQCDIINLKFGKPGAAVDFSFAFQVTPVKPLLKEWRNWSFQLGSKLPGMKAVQICESGSDLGFFDAFCVIPNNKDYSYAKAFRETIRKRQVPLYIMQKIDTDAREKLKAQQLRVRGKVDNNSINRALNEMQTRFMQVGMTADAVIKYSCQSLINMQDEAYQYHKAEWATRYQYREGHVDRIFSTRRMMEYELWAYKKMLEAGSDGIYLDEVYVQPQTNPELSLYRDYKGRVIPEMGLLTLREMNKRLAHCMYDLGMKEMPFCVHLTNSNIIPVFAFANISYAWEYWMSDNFITQFPLDYTRTVASGRQCGMIPVVLMNIRIPERGQIPHEEFIRRYNRLFRTGLGLMIQDGIYTNTRYWRDDTEQYKVRYVQWAFGTHKDDTVFTPYWMKNLPFKASENFVLGAYRRGNSHLLLLTNLSKASEATVELDMEKMGLKAGDVLMDAITGELFPMPNAKIPVPECEFRMLFAGSREFGDMLRPPEPDNAFLRK